MGCLGSHVINGALQAKLGSLSGLCMEEYVGHENFKGLEVNWWLLIVIDNLKIGRNNLKVQNSQLRA